MLKLKEREREEITNKFKIEIEISYRNPLLQKYKEKTIPKKKVP